MARTWTIGTDRSDGGIIANSLDGPMPNYQRGKQIQVTFKFWSESGISRDFQTRYTELREYTDYAQAVSTMTTVSGVPAYTERLPDEATVPSQVVDLVPDSSIKQTPGLWVAVTGGRDDTRFVEDLAQITLRCFVLAELGQYASRSDVEADLSGGVV